MSAQFSFYLETLSFALLAIPLCGLLWLAGRAPDTTSAIKRFALAVLAVVAIVFILPPHEDVFTGIDNSAYRLMAETFSEGRPIVGQDTSAELVPENLRLYLRYRQPSKLRATRDIVFQTGQNPKNTNSWPFFMPFLPMAAAGSGFISRFPILLGAFWFVLLFLAVKAKRSIPTAVAVTAALIIASPIPLWFCRGYFADAAGAFIACAPLLTNDRHSIGNSVCSGLLLGLSVTIHPTSVLIAAPIFIYLILSSRQIKPGIMTVLSAIAGTIPLFFITRYICHPYGDWTRLANLRQIFAATGEHAALASGALLLASFAIAAICAAYNCKIRAKLSSIAAKIPSTLWVLAALLPAAILCFLPGEIGIAIKKGFISFFNTLGVSGFLVFALILFTAFYKTESTSLKLLVMLLCWTAIPFALIKGVEVPAGIWSFRRLAPTVIAMLSAGALCSTSVKFPLMQKSGADEFLQTYAVHSAILVVGLALLMFNIGKSPLSYFGVNDAGAVQLRDELKSAFADADVVFFDYHPHSTPFACKLGKPVFGLGRFATDKWPDVEKWLSEMSVTSRVMFATSYVPCLLEDGVALVHHEPKSHFGAKFTFPKSPGIMPSVKAEKSFTISLLDAVPLSVSNLVQRKIFDGGPIGLRGNWFQRPGKEGMWSREKCGIIGPVRHGKITVAVEAQWFPPSGDWKTQQILITPPWGGTPEKVELTSERATVTVAFEGPDIPEGTGTYTITAQKPYSPAAFGQKGYPDDLGALFYSVSIE